MLPSLPNYRPRNVCTGYRTCAGLAGWDIAAATVPAVALVGIGSDAPAAVAAAPAGPSHNTVASSFALVDCIPSVVVVHHYNAVAVAAQRSSGSDHHCLQLHRPYD